MSILSGMLKDRGVSADGTELRVGSLLTERYATGSCVVFASGRLGMCIQPYMSHKRSALEIGPRLDSHGNVLSLDGRLDNFQELARELGLDAYTTSDSDIVLSAYQRWGERSFARFTGDWALALWSEEKHTLYLVRDHAGVRTLFYRFLSEEMRWATHLESFVADGQLPPLSRNYIAASLSAQHLRDLTPYQGVHSVPPAHLIALHDGKISVERHWSAFGRSELRNRSDNEYDEEFLALFRQSVTRRTEDGAPIVAELSGGMDSTSIVCVCDQFRRLANPDAVLLDTVSYYDDEEASLDERRYFSITESKRGKHGVHLDTAYSQRTFLPHDISKGAYLTPGADSLSVVREGRFDELVWRKGYRAILSGVGGDELLGGVPDRNPELSAHLVSGHWGRFIKRSMAWSLSQRVPLIQTAGDALQYTARSYMGLKPNRPIPPWLAKDVKETAEERSETLPRVASRWTYNPRQLDNERTWWSILETLPHCFPRLLTRPEYRYPYLDKDLVEFLHRVPRAQLIQPGRRRLLMRRALRDIVPEEILERKQKAFQLRSPLLKLQQRRDYLHSLFADSILEQLGCIDSAPFLATIDRACAGDMTYWFSLMQTIAVELWLRSSHAPSAARNLSENTSSAATSAAIKLRLCAS